jgi:hypothetical protein
MLYVELALAVRRIFFLIRIVGGGVQMGPLGTSVTECPIVPGPGWLWWWRIWWNEDWQGKPKYSEKICPSATLSTTNPTWPDPGANPGCRGGKPATNRLSYGATKAYSYYVFNISDNTFYQAVKRVDRRSGVGGEWSASRLGCFAPRRKSPRYPLDRKVGGPHSRSGWRGEQKILDPTGTRNPTSRSSSP